MITENDVKRLATLAKLEVDEKEMLIYLNEMQSKLMIECSDYDFADRGVFCPLREDKVLPSMPREDALSNAIHSENGFFKLRK